MIPKQQRRILKYMFVEILLLNLCVFLVMLLRTPELFYKPVRVLFFNDLLPLLSIFNLSWILIVLNIGRPDYYIRDSFRKKMNQMVLSTFILIGLTSTMVVFFKVVYFNRTIILTPVFLFTILNLLFFSILTKYKKHRYATNSDANVLMIGGRRKWNQLLNFSNTIQSLGYETIGFLNDNKQKRFIIKDNNKLLGQVKDLPKVLDAKKIDEIFINSSSLNRHEIQSVIEVADNRGIRVNLIPEAPFINGTIFKTSELNGFPIFRHREIPLDNFNNYLLKRFFDTVFSASVLIFLSPLYLLIAMLIYIDNRGPIMYTPIRKGEEGKPFKCYKFRSMSVCDDPVNGKVSTIKDDPRITRIGKYLRKYDLDELPQFYNVLRGEMSVVGPRPHRINLQTDFRKIVNDYMVRHFVRPGITGWAQVNGWRGPTGTIKQKKERIKHDLWYIENWSLWLDVKIIFLTIFSKKTRENAF